MCFALKSTFSIIIKFYYTNSEMVCQQRTSQPTGQLYTIPGIETVYIYHIIETLCIHNIHIHIHVYTSCENLYTSILTSIPLRFSVSCLGGLYSVP